MHGWEYVRVVWLCIEPDCDSGIDHFGRKAGTGPVAAQPSSVIGYLNFDSAGHIIPQAAWANMSSAQTTYSTLAFTGTYTVNPDCSGAMTISNSSSLAATGASSASAITIDFVISPPTITASAGSSNPNGFSGPPDLNLSFTNSNVAGWGYAFPQ